MRPPVGSSFDGDLFDLGAVHDAGFPAGISSSPSDAGKGCYTDDSAQSTSGLSSPFLFRSGGSSTSSVSSQNVFGFIDDDMRRRDPETDIRSMSTESLQSYSVKLTTRLQTLERENASLRTKVARQEKDFARNASQRHQRFVARHNIYLDKLRVVHAHLETERKIREESEAEVERMRAICREAADRLKRCLKERIEAQERCDEIEITLSESSYKYETMQQLAQHFREQCEFERLQRLELEARLKNEPR